MNHFQEAAMNFKSLLLLMGFSLAGLGHGERAPGGQNARPLIIDGVPSSIREATVSGPVFRAPEVFQGAEDYHNPRIQQLRSEYDFLEEIANEGDEFGKILRLRHWVYRQWPVDNEQRFNGDAFAILEKARDGQGFHCAHSMTVQQAVLTAAGYVARNLGIDTDHRKFGRSYHHGINEVWSNDYAKWVALDAKYDIHFEREGAPLSALELHEAVRAGSSQEVRMVEGPDRRPVRMGQPGEDQATIESYWWISYHIRQNSFTQPHVSGGSWLVVPYNEAFRSQTWHRGAGATLGPHWAYAAKAFIPVASRHHIEWTPGVTSLARTEPMIEGQLRIQPRSATPNLKDYLCRINGGRWRPIDPGQAIVWPLEEGKNAIEVRTRNMFGVEGPIAMAAVYYSP
jgi:hypothetical protein